MLFAVAATVLGGIGNLVGCGLGGGHPRRRTEQLSILFIPSAVAGLPALRLPVLRHRVLFPSGFHLPERSTLDRVKRTLARARPAAPAGRSARLDAMDYLYTILILIGLLRHSGVELQPDHRPRRADLDRASDLLRHRRLCARRCWPSDSGRADPAGDPVRRRGRLRRVGCCWRCRRCASRATIC